MFLLDCPIPTMITQEDLEGIDALHCHIFEQTVKNYSKMVLKEITLNSLLLNHRILNKIETPWK